MKTRVFHPPVHRKRQRAFHAFVSRGVRSGFFARIPAITLLLLPVVSTAQGPPNVGIPAGGATAPPPARDNSAVGIAAREAARRLETIEAARELLTAAEYDRSENRNKEAMEQLQTAYRSVADVPAAREMRDAIFGRYQTAALAYARELVAQARWEDAEAVLTEVMNTARDSGKLPSQVDPGIRTLMGQLKGDHFNKSVTPQHLDHVTLVERNLKEAGVLMGIGRYDGARERYHRVLNLDRYNVAARRGLEELEREVINYHKHAYNHTRAAKLREGAELWSLQPPPDMAVDLPDTELTTAGTGQARLQGKLRSIVLDQIEFQDTPLRTVVEYLVQKAEELDVASDPNSRGLNIVIDTTGGPPVDDKPVTVRLSNVPLGDILRYVTQQVGMKYRVDEFAVSIVPVSAPDETKLITRSYDVPPGFLSGDDGGGGGGAAPDPFDPQPQGGPGAGTIVRRLSARETLEKRGVTFPPGASAQMTGDSRLIVRNNSANIELIESLILAARETGNQLVRVDLKMISIAEETVKEMGFDFLLGGFNIGGEKVFGSGGTPGNQAGNRQIQDFPFGDVGNNPVTSGLRSGDTSVTQSIEDVIARDAPSSPISMAAPGVFGLAGVFTDPQFQFVWRALNQQDGMDRLCMTSVLTRPGERAVIREVREFIYPTEYDPPQIPNSVGIFQLGNLLIDTGLSGVYPTTPATPTAFETRDLGKILEVEPVIGADGITVNLNLSTDVSDFVGFINYGTPITQIMSDSLGLQFAPVEITENEILMPVFDAVKQTTNVSIYDGQTVVIGGLLGEQIDEVNDKVPVLGDAPGIGKFFRSEIAEHKRRALVLFATIRILDSAGRPFNDLSQFTEGGATTAQAN